MRFLLITLAVILAGVVVARVVGKPKGTTAPRAAQLPSVDVVLAREGSLRGEQEFTGTTRATREVSLRARTEGRLLKLAADVGDPVQRGQEVARLDDEIQRTQLRQAEAELASRESEVSAAQIQVGEARTRVEQARLDLAQKQANAKRVRSLYALGYESRQFYEETRTATRIAGQVLRSTEAQVKNAQSAVYSAQGRVAAQRAVIAQERERLSYSVIRSPMDGFVTFRLVQAGDLISPGAEMLRIGDFTLVQVDVEISELDVREIKVGQPAAITLDAFAGEEFIARVDRMSRQADPVSRLVPLTLTLPNPGRRIGAGLLARVRFEPTGAPRVVVPETALNVVKPPAEDKKAPNPSQAGPEEKSNSKPRPTEEGEQGIVLVINGEGRAPERSKGGDRKEDPTQKVYVVTARPVHVTARSDGQAEIAAGLSPGERVISRSSRPLSQGDEVRPSMLSAEALSAPPLSPSQSDSRGSLQPPAGPARPGTGPKSAGDPGSGRAATGPARPGGATGGGGSGRPLFGPVSPNTGYGSNYSGDPGRPFTGRSTLPAPPSGGFGNGGRPGGQGRNGTGTGTGGTGFGGRPQGGTGTGSGGFGGVGGGSTGTGTGVGGGRFGGGIGSGSTGTGTGSGAGAGR